MSAAELGLLDPTAPTATTTVLLVEDDDGDALLVEELVVDSGERFALRRVRTAAEAARTARGAQCALVDLGLPDAVGLEAIATIRAASPDLAVVVLTGLGDRERGIEAVAAGAQDYLVKGEVDGPALARAIRYAIERRRADADARRLLLAEQRQAENDRLARGLLPRLALDSSGVAVATRYLPGGPEALLGGDFFDAVALPDGRVRAVIGDVCGHGPDEAAVGVALRIAWRTLVLADCSPEDVLAGVDAILRQERHEANAFATVCDLTIDPAAAALELRLHGHPPPLVVAPEVGWVEGASPAMPLGCFDHQDAPVHRVDLPAGWQLLLMTDGVYEGRSEGPQRLGMDGFAGLVSRLAEGGPGAEVLLDRVLQAVGELHGGSLDDDTALLWLGSR